MARRSYDAPFLLALGRDPRTSKALRSLGRWVIHPTSPPLADTWWRKWLQQAFDADIVAMDIVSGLSGDEPIDLALIDRDFGEPPMLECERQLRVSTFDGPRETL